jgi:hypothetical protein
VAASVLLEKPSPSRPPCSVAWRYAPVVLATAVLACATIHAILTEAGGPAVPLDDAYIHFQYARSFAELHPFRYTPGATPTPGATSLLWPLLLAPFHALGLRGDSLVWAAWALGWTSLALLAVETKRLADGLVSAPVAVAAGTMVVAFGGFAWFAASGMEVLPFAWLLARSARFAAEWMEGGERDDANREARHFRELLALSVVTPLMRPEGAIASLTIAAALLVRPYRGRRGLSALPFLAPLLPNAVCFLATGQAIASTALSKWLVLNPYYRGPRLASAIFGNVQIFFGTLLNGQLWTSVFLPEGGRAIGVLALIAIPVAAVSRHRMPRGLCVLALALAVLAPASYETFLVNRVRYIWPFAPAWFVGLSALSELAGNAVRKLASRLGAWAPEQLALLPAGTIVGLFASRLGPSIDDVATSARAVTAQQVSMARWARETLPANARIGVNDTGAMAYFSNHSTFDVVGLTTAGEARYWRAGAGSRFEHYERLGAARLPTHFAVYPEWFQLDALLGTQLTKRSVRHTILGGYTMATYEARYDLLGSGESPLAFRTDGRRRVDVLDVADLEDEAAHGYLLLDALQQTDVVVSGFDRADGARILRQADRFSLQLVKGGVFVARWGAEGPARVHVWASGRDLGMADLDGSAWQEIAIPLPPDVATGMHTMDVRAEGTTPFQSLHYWSYE